MIGGQATPPTPQAPEIKFAADLALPREMLSRLDRKASALFREERSVDTDWRASLARGSGAHRSVLVLDGQPRQSNLLNVPRILSS